jgi:hypothetical protein
VFVHIDAESLRRGSTVPGSICHIDGLGPIDLDAAQALLGEAFVVALLEDTTGDIRSVIHLGRQVTAHQRSALEARGYRCEVPGCDVTWGLEIEHHQPYAATGVTTLDELWWACGRHHHEKTHLGATLTGPPGNRTWTAPDGTALRDRPPPVEHPSVLATSAP